MSLKTIALFVTGAVAGGVAGVAIPQMSPDIPLAQAPEFNVDATRIASIEAACRNVESLALRHCTVSSQAASAFAALPASLGKLTEEVTRTAEETRSEIAAQNCKASQEKLAALDVRLTLATGQTIGGRLDSLDEATAAAVSAIKERATQIDQIGEAATELQKCSALGGRIEATARALDTLSARLERYFDVKVERYPTPSSVTFRLPRFTTDEDCRNVWAVVRVDDKLLTERAGPAQGGGCEANFPDFTGNLSDYGVRFIEVQRR